jgi:structural maintenance of chromosome 4
LGNLGIIDEKYDVAISTACGGLNDIIVDDVKSAQECIQFLRQNNLGRAVFAVLEKLPKNDMRRISTPENVPRLFDLVKPKDKKFANAFYNALRDTLVAKDMEQAKRIAYGAKRWRVVTLKGELIDKSGTMSGGGNRVAKGYMSSAFASHLEVSPRELQQMQETLVKSEQELQVFHSKMISLQNQLQDKQQEIPQITLLIQKLEIDRESVIKQIKASENQLSELR